MRGHALIVGIGLFLAACSGGEAAPTTSPPTSAAPTTSSTMTTTVAPTTSTEVETATTVPVVDGIPEEALALIGAPMPDVPAYADGFDPEVWFEAYAAWNQWAFANPEEGLASLDQWVVPGSEMDGSLRAQLERLVAEGWNLIGTEVISIVDFELADELLGEGFVSLNLVTRVSGVSLLIDENKSKVSEEEFSGDHETRSQLALEAEGEAWLLASWR